MAKAKKTASPKDRMRIRAAAIKALERPGRRITAEILVEAARSPSHPLHSDFTWDDSKAAHQHRLNEARAIICTVRVVTVTSTRKVVVPCYVRDQSAAPLQGYIAVARLKSDREQCEESLLYETSRLQAQLERCREIASALDLESEFDSLLQTTLDLRSRIRRGRPAEAEPRVSV